MIEVTRTQLLPGVHLTAVQTQKFKSSVLGMQFLLPLAREQAALQALLPMVLRRGTAEHPDMESLSAVLDELYGGSLEPTVRKKGENQCVGFVASLSTIIFFPAGNRCSSRWRSCWVILCATRPPATAVSFRNM